ncbi:MAG: hypothetical protein KDI36_12860 [Pseudomonadales bacterium]|nr:hypothetical protein [Pseudomonadales bacterium]
MSTNHSAAFRLGDIRGIYPSDINESFIYQFARIFTRHFGLAGKRVVTGRDTRHSGESLQQALNQGLLDSGLEVLDLGISATEVGYFASVQTGISAALMVTASHNPGAYNGLKCILAGGKVVTFETGLRDIMYAMAVEHHEVRMAPEQPQPAEIHEHFCDFISGKFSGEPLQGLRMALNPMFGTAVPTASALAASLGLNISWLNQEAAPVPPEGPDPIKPDRLAEMQRFMARGQYDLGVAWDGDADRCLFFDGTGNLIPTYYVVGMFATAALERSPGAAIVYDSKLCWNTEDIIARHRGKPVIARTGHAFMKEKMQSSGAAYGGELSGHHYFGDFFGCDSGMYAWLEMVRILSHAGKDLASLTEEYRRQIRCTREVSLKIGNFDALTTRLMSEFEVLAEAVTRVDGLAIHLGNWRMSIVPSKTEDTVRFNFEGRCSEDELLEGANHVLRLASAYVASEEAVPTLQATL